MQARASGMCRRAVPVSGGSMVSRSHRANTSVSPSVTQHASVGLFGLDFIAAVRRRVRTDDPCLPRDLHRLLSLASGRMDVSLLRMRLRREVLHLRLCPHALLSVRQ